MSERQEASLSIFYSVRIRRTKRSRVIVDLVRDNYSKQLCHLHEGELKYASKKPRHFFDNEDERKIAQKCGELWEQSEPEYLGSVELKLFLFKGPQVQVRHPSGELVGIWDPDFGLRLASDAHPVFRGDKKTIAKICSELPLGSGGIFRADDLEEPIL